ncbi:MAG: RNA polymerase sigma-70 factor [Chlorobi bacterium]|nr:RNA polymerase sigma-70 factor [Chlorobiota bacterium]
MKFKDQILTDDCPEFKIIFKKYFPSLYLFAVKLTKNEFLTKDIVQEVFIKTWKSSNNFENENALKAFLYLSTKNQCIDHLRKRKDYKPNVPVDEKLFEETYLDEVVREETFRLLDIVIEQLPPQRRKIVELTLKGMGNNEIAESLQISVNTVKTHKLRAYKTIREFMGSQFAVIILTELVNFF